MIAEKVQSQADFIRWMDKVVDGQEVSNDLGTCLGGASLDLAMEYHKAIVMLVDGKLYGPALAMMRPMKEAFVRGIWLLDCATESQLKIVVEGKDFPNLHVMLQAIESTPIFSERVLSLSETNTKRLLHGFTHGGIEQLGRRLTGTTIEPNFDDAEIVELLDYALALGALSAINILRISGDADGAKEILERVKQL